MTRTIPLTAVLSIFLLYGHAQPQAYETKIDYQKIRQPAAAIDLPYPTDVVQDGIKNYLSAKGLKGSSSKGYNVYRGARLSDSAADLNDLYFKIERRSGDRKSSVVTLLATKPSEDPATRAEGAIGSLDGAKLFLNSLVPAVEARNLEVEIDGEEAIYKKALKKASNLQDDQSDLEKKIRYAQADLEQNKKDQLTQTQEMQSNIHGDNDAMAKAQKKMNKLLDAQASLEKKIRKYQADLDQNKKDQDVSHADVKQQQQVLDSMKARRKN
jgi:hypothetical protein